MMSCARCHLHLNVGICPECSVDMVSDEMGERLTYGTKLLVAERMREHLRHMNHKAKQLIGNREKYKALVEVEQSERSLKEAEDIISNLMFHLDRAGYPKEILNAAVRLSAMISVKQLIGRKKSENI